MRFRHLFAATVILVAACYTPPGVRVLKNADAVPERTLFIALDGVDFELVSELYEEGHFRDFLPPLPFISTFPSDTTLGFTGILQPLDVGRVPGYESRFYSYRDNKIIGGTPFDIYKIPVNYKYYFDAFRHQILEKAVMYVFPGLAGKEDLIGTEKVLYGTDKRILMTYLGGTDGSSHVLGRQRTKRFLVFMEDYLKKMVQRYRERKSENLRIVLFSDHGFRHNRLKTLTRGDIERAFRGHGFRLGATIATDRDAVTVTFGLLSAGVIFTPLAHRDEMAGILSGLPGVDLVFWHMNDPRRVSIRNASGETAYFEYKDGAKKYRYVATRGDPLGYGHLQAGRGRPPGAWLTDAEWKHLTWDAVYPDAGFRLYDAFFHLVENPANIMFSMKPDYQFGSFIARVATWLKFGHRGTHGGLFRDTTWGVAMTNRASDKPWPRFLRYDELFRFFLPEVTGAYKKTGAREVTIVVSPEQYRLAAESDGAVPPLETGPGAASLHP